MTLSTLTDTDGGLNRGQALYSCCMKPQIALFKLGINPFELLPQSPGTCRALQFSERGCQASLKRVKEFRATWGCA
jgi:hypothetical protein